MKLSVLLLGAAAVFGLTCDKEENHAETQLNPSCNWSGKCAGSSRRPKCECCRPLDEDNWCYGNEGFTFDGKTCTDLEFAYGAEVGTYIAPSPTPGIKCDNGVVPPNDFYSTIYTASMQMALASLGYGGIFMPGPCQECTEEEPCNNLGFPKTEGIIVTFFTEFNSFYDPACVTGDMNMPSDCEANFDMSYSAMKSYVAAKGEDGDDILDALNAALPSDTSAYVENLMYSIRANFLMPDPHDQDDTPVLQDGEPYMPDMPLDGTVGIIIPPLDGETVIVEPVTPVADPNAVCDPNENDAESMLNPKCNWSGKCEGGRRPKCTCCNPMDPENWCYGKDGLSFEGTTCKTLKAAYGASVGIYLESETMTCEEADLTSVLQNTFSGAGYDGVFMKADCQDCSDMPCDMLPEMKTEGLALSFFTEFNTYYDTGCATAMMAPADCPANTDMSDAAKKAFAEASGDDGDAILKKMNTKLPENTKATMYMASGMYNMIDNYLMPEPEKPEKPEVTGPCDPSNNDAESMLNPDCNWSGKCEGGRRTRCTCCDPEDIENWCYDKDGMTFSGTTCTTVNAPYVAAIGIYLNPSKITCDDASMTASKDLTSTVQDIYNDAAYGGVFMPTLCQTCTEGMPCDMLPEAKTEGIFLSFATELNSYYDPKCVTGAMEPSMCDANTDMSSKALKAFKKADADYVLKKLNKQLSKKTVAEMFVENLMYYMKDNHIMLKDDDPMDDEPGKGTIIIDINPTDPIDIDPIEPNVELDCSTAFEDLCCDDEAFAKSCVQAFMDNDGCNLSDKKLDTLAKKGKIDANCFTCDSIGKKAGEACAAKDGEDKCGLTKKGEKCADKKCCKKNKGCVFDKKKPACITPPEPKVKGYKKMIGSSCEKLVEEVNKKGKSKVVKEKTIEKAAKKCKKLKEGCTGIVDMKCDNSGPFGLCAVPVLADAPSDDCVWIKTK